MIRRFIYAFGWFFAALTKPQVFNIHYFKLVESMMKFLEETAKNQSPMSSELRITKLAKILYDDENKPFLHLWCGVNEIENPIARLRQLAEENEKLKEMLNNDKKVQVSDTTKAD